ncbi:PAS/PAC sensor signal transduction histidine kinase [Cytophaga hutchinsonii ATCC 33406]|nr:PAS/PAC sensor signal transduction histidine kinase [Cytophaga hutchinsonii ATCC 33406]
MLNKISRVIKAITRRGDTKTFKIESSKYKMLLNEASDAIYWVNHKGLITYANPSAQILFGYEEVELKDKSISDLIVSKTDLFSTFSSNIIEEKGVVIQQEFVRKDNSTFYGEMSVRLFDDGSHQAIIRDITKGVIEQRLLLDRERKFKILVENAFDIIIVLSSDFKIKFISPAIKKMLGYEIDSVLGENSNKFIEFRDRVMIKEVLKNHGITYAINDLKLIHKNGQIIHCEVNAVNFLNDPLINGIIVNCHDISKRIQTENELINTNYELDSFVYKVSHDLKAPLRSMLGLINLSQKENTEDTVKLYLDMMVRSIHNMDIFIKDLTQFSRNSRMEVIKESIDFKELITKIENNLKYDDNARFISFERNISQQSLFYSDPNRVETIVSNLLSNAYKYHRFDSNNPYINVKIEVSETAACIVIKDNGSGIADEYHNKIFQMFFRASEKSQGSGLGLYIVKSAIDKLEGTITLHSIPDKESTFTVEIPNLLTR